MEATTAALDTGIRRRDPVTWGQVCDWHTFLADHLGLAEKIEEAEAATREAVMKKPISAGDAMAAIRQTHTRSVQIQRSDILRVMLDREARVELAAIFFERADGQPLTDADCYLITGEALWKALFFSNEESERLTAALQGYAPGWGSEGVLPVATRSEAT